MTLGQKQIAHFEKLCQSRTRAFVLAMLLTVFAVVCLQNFIRSPGNRSSFFLLGFGRTGSLAGAGGAAEVRSSGDSKDPAFSSENRGAPLADERDERRHELSSEEAEPDDFEIDGDGEEENDLLGTTLKKLNDAYGGYITIQNSPSSSVGMHKNPGGGYVPLPREDAEANSHGGYLAPSPSPYPGSSRIDDEQQRRNSSNVASNSSSPGAGEVRTEALKNGEQIVNCRAERDQGRKKKIRGAAFTISDLNRMLSERIQSSSSLIPQRASENDLQILEARKQIINAPVIRSDPELYPPIFRNISMFKRSYDLMESILKVFVYKEGEKPIFHQPELTGIYSSEGWFMKHMEGSRRFVVDDPRRAHLFYIPFSSRLLQTRLYVPGSHSHANLIAYLQTYVDMIAAKYPFWNRTCGADHFVVACHDWATHETGRAMGTSIRALCNADATEDFEVGKDVSLPETNVRNRENPLRGLGGDAAKRRPVLAFFAGQMHGYLRPILLRHWENKDPDIKVFGPLPRGGKKEKKGKKGKKKKKGAEEAYVQYMKSSRYCICPRGYEVNSPRVVEAIFYECVPVIISDNFVPPFFEVLNWEAFSVVLPEKDVPRLKEILAAIPRRRYLRLQMGVRRVQRHFLWNRRPVRYDLFHMILHSIWFNRVFQLRLS